MTDGRTATPWRPGPGDVLGPYRLVEQLEDRPGPPAFKATVEPGHPNADDEIVLHLLPPDQAEDDRWVSEVTEEARTAGQVDHPGVVRVLDTGTVSGHAFVATEPVRGLSLKIVMGRLRGRGETVPPQAAAALIARVARALHAAQQTGQARRGRPLIHRNLSPAEIWLTASGVRVSGLGIPRPASGRLAAHRPQLSVRLGYMAPEQVAGTPVGVWTDVFACGVILHELLCGRPLFAGNTRSETITAIKAAQVKPPSSICPWVDRDLDRTTLAALDPNPERRPADGAELARALERYLEARHPDFRLEDWLAETAGRSPARAEHGAPEPRPAERLPAQLKLQDAPTETLPDEAGAQPTGTVPASQVEGRARPTGTVPASDTPPSELEATRTASTAPGGPTESQRMGPGRFLTGWTLDALLAAAAAVLIVLTVRGFLAGRKAPAETPRDTETAKAAEHRPAAVLTAQSGPVTVRSIRYRVEAHRMSTPSGSAPAALTIDLSLTNLGNRPASAPLGDLRLRLAKGGGVKPAYWKVDPSDLRPGERRRVRVGFPLPSPTAANRWRLEIP